MLPRNSHAFLAQDDEHVWWVYVPMCFNGRIYIGMALDVEQRFRTTLPARRTIHADQQAPLHYGCQDHRARMRRERKKGHEAARQSPEARAGSVRANQQARGPSAMKPSTRWTRHYNRTGSAPKVP